jgi:alpha-aminoadipic semialdehyde synthase
MAGRHLSTLASFEDRRHLNIGISRETYDKWERRTPLCPKHVQGFLERHPLSQVIVQPSHNRVFTNQEYEKVGARIQEDLSEADLILGVKRPKSMDDMLAEKTYMFFSHVIKGQTENMPLLQECLAKKIQLIDYECIVDSSDTGTGKRLIAFGEYAGFAGMVDVFPALGRRLLMKNNWSTPFLNCPPTIHHCDLAGMKQSVTQMADRLAMEGLPDDMEPLVFAMTGKGGNVYRGVREIFDLLPHETVSVEDLPELQQLQGPQYKVYAVSPEKHEIYQRKRDGEGFFERSDYMENPHLYKSTFAEKVAPYSNVIVNGAYWDYRFPRILTKDDIEELYINGNER